MRHLQSRIKSIFTACLLALVFPVLSLYAQVEHVPVVHPVYQALMRWEAMKLLPADFSSSVLPLQRKEITAALAELRKKANALNASDEETLRRFWAEFAPVVASVAAAPDSLAALSSPSPHSTVFLSSTDTTQALFDKLFTPHEKNLYRYHDSTLAVRVVPLVALDVRRYADAGGAENIVLADVGGRIFGTIDGAFGFFLQGTNGALLSGNRASQNLQTDPVLRKNATWRFYTGGNSGNFDFSESHVRYDYRWFYAGAGRETRLIGSGYANRLLFSDNPPVADAIMLGAKFHGFEYRFTHFSLLGQPEPNPNSIGAGTNIPSKFMSYHRIAMRGSWGEVGIGEQLIYSRRGMELAYLLPVSFLRAVSNALRDRDNLQMSADLTLRPFAGVQLKGTFVLDDLTFGEIGKGYWANKTAWNIGAMFAPAEVPLDGTLEYARVEPYTFSHFDVQNAATHEQFLFAGHLFPNSDELTARVRVWYGNRYPISIATSWRRHGRNIVDAQGALTRNVGGDILQTLRRDTTTFQYIDSERVTFLDGDLQSRFALTVAAGFEIARQWNVQARYQFSTTNGIMQHTASLVLRFEDF